MRWTPACAGMTGIVVQGGANAMTTEPRHRAEDAPVANT